MGLVELKVERAVRLSASRVPIGWVLEDPRFKTLMGDTLLRVRGRARRYRAAVIPVYKSTSSDAAEGFITVHDVLLARSFASTRSVGSVVRRWPLATFEESVSRAYELMSRYGLPGILVVDDLARRSVVGLVTALGLLRELMYMDPPEEARPVSSSYTELGDGVISLHWREPVTRVIDEIAGGRVLGVVVVNDEGGPQGTITVWDLIRTGKWFTRSEHGPKAVMGAAQVSRGESRRVGVMRVQRLMRRGVPAAAMETPMRSVMRFMASTGIELVPVVDGDGVVRGAVTLRDALRE